MPLHARELRPGRAVYIVGGWPNIVSDAFIRRRSLSLKTTWRVSAGPILGSAVDPAEYSLRENAGGFSQSDRTADMTAHLKQLADIIRAEHAGLP